MNRDLLIILAKYPTPGQVKTRLAAEIGKRAAAAVYRKLLRHHAREFADAEFDVAWRFTPKGAAFARWLCDATPHKPGMTMLGGTPRSSLLSPGIKVRGNMGWTCRPQPPGNLGQRMQRIFAEAFARGYQRVVMIGTDCPVMSRRTVRRAFRWLRKFPAVFQPTDDGGYALIGLREMLPIFSGIAWSTERVMAQTRRRLQSRGVSFRELPMTFDVDTAADLPRLKKGFR